MLNEKPVRSGQLPRARNRFAKALDILIANRSRFIHVHVLITLITLLVWGGAAAGPQVYRNEEFGIRLPIPKAVLYCVPPEDEHDHGPVFLLQGTKSQACDELSYKRYIAIFAGYNAVDTTKRLGDYLTSECTGIGRGPCRPAPRDLQIAGMRSKAGRVNRADGWIDIFVVTQAGKPDPQFDASVPSVNYDLSLHTTRRHLDEDLRTFREMLATVRLSPPE
ncbi:MAG: hypothetical protein WAN14_06975 [Candidatus Acidiferrales bacterium]